MGGSSKPKRHPVFPRLGFGQRIDRFSCEVSVEMLGHLEHCRLCSTSEDCLQLSIGHDLAPVFRVLTAIVFDVLQSLMVASTRARCDSGGWPKAGNVAIGTKRE
jgi:hypothetical protein